MKRDALALPLSCNKKNGKKGVDDRARLFVIEPKASEPLPGSVVVEVDGVPFTEVEVVDRTLRFLAAPRDGALVDVQYSPVGSCD